MVKLGYHASHEQFAPSALLKYVQKATQAGFTAALSSDHFHPWSEDQGHSGFSFAWLGAAMQATDLPFGMVCAPGQRYHPAIVAQAAATLAEMFPDRFWIAVGSGQNLNEHITGEQWPTKSVRNARLEESVRIMRALWAGETVTHHGLIQVEDAKLYSRPQTPPKIIGAAITPATAEWVAGWADGMITISHPMDMLREVVNAFRRGGGEGKPIYLKVQLSYAESEEVARRGAHEQWRTNVFESKLLSQIRMPDEFDAMAQSVRPEDMDEHVRISADPQQHIDWLQQYIELGFDQLLLHNVNRDQDRFIDVFGDKVLPALR